MTRRTPKRETALVEDAAFITTLRTLMPVTGLVPHAPHVGQTMFVLGFPRVPHVPAVPLVMHSGEVTNQSLTMASEESGFLYSATRDRQQRA